ncbi:MAG: TonB C-terminal domain-containing protein [Mariprofundaceae bacterium]|nr:TonB C-terminal domain-containing protein [Mariprofundaceae bacterium]
MNLRLVIALVLSVLLHGLLVFIITFVNPEPEMVKKETPKVMDVVLFDPRTMPKAAKENPDAKTIANRTLKGSSKQAKDHSTRRAKAPPPAKQRQKTPPKLVPQIKQKPKPTPKATPKPTPREKAAITRKTAPKKINTTPKKVSKLENKEPKKNPLNIPLANLIPSSMALSELSRDFERERRLKQMLSKEADIPINTREAKYAPYAHALIRSLEEQWRPGEADYKTYQEHERQVLMRLTIEYKGQLGNLEMLRGSPIPELNESAVEAIYAAAPFKPLPRSWGLDRASFYLTFEVVDDKIVFRTL